MAIIYVILNRKIKHLLFHELLTLLFYRQTNVEYQFLRSFFDHIIRYLKYIEIISVFFIFIN